MQHFHKILVGVDLSQADRLATSELNAPTREAVKRATWLASHSGAELTIYAALDISAQTKEVLREIERTTKTVEDEAITVLDELVEAAKKDGVNASATLEIGSPWEGMIKQVVHKNHDLVIVGTRDQSRAARLLFGSTAMKLMRNCPCPVWVTKPDPNWDDLNILVASDFSETSDLSLELAVAAGQLTDAKLHVLNAFEDQFGRRLWLTGMPPDRIQAHQDKQRAEAESALHEQLSHTDYRTLPHGVLVHVIDAPADIAIVDAIEEHGIDLLIMGTAARSGISGVLIGNTAERLLAQVSCSVVAIKPPGFECPIKFDS